ncbi:hypothetical protein EXIGLDRAFT_342681 [Exidia glandulosa HHB12029]|uniref:ERCC4 domain-containing protein n=1 Tax=Exidia glandulosa HHB12029 TaxID=1314781 RepID=A0A165LHD1_EXIGL|nr:hypothetical protein EXIGLDRAFT_342681 [Exidia glandulosa HHB12029]
MILHVPARLAALRPVLAALPHAMVDDGGKKFDIVENAQGELIRWARKETATYDALAREWVPCEERIRFENACMLFTTVEEIASQRFDVLGRVREAKTGGQQVFLMIHGRRVDALEGILARVQIIHKCFIVHVEDAADAAARIVNITGDLAIRPYKIIHMTHLPFAPDLIKPCSRGEKDTYLHMLAQIPTVTPTIAKNIALQYPTFDKLLAALEGKQSAREQMGVFLGIPLGQKNGATLGADRARHLVDLLFAEDPLVTIG